MSLSYHDTQKLPHWDTQKLPHWARCEWQHDPYKYESQVWFGVKCADGYVQLRVTMPEEFGQKTITRRKILQDMIEQLTVQLATATLEET